MSGPQPPPAHPQRVRVVAPRRPRTHSPGGTSVSQEVAEHSAVGEVMVRSLIRSQLRLALVVGSGFCACLLLCWVFGRWVPTFLDWRLWGVPVPWLILGVAVYPIMILSAWLYVRAATRNEQQYRALVDEP